MTSASQQPSEVDWLASDINQYEQAIRSSIESFKVLADHRDPDRHNHYELVVDLFFRAYHHAIGLHTLVQQRLAVPANAVSRAFLEAVISLGYLAHCKKPIEAAVVLRAYEYIKETQLFGKQTELVQERAAILRRMPEPLVRLARHRVKKNEHWTGLSLKRTAAIAKVTGLDIHSYLSEDVHSRIVGHHVRLTPTPNGKATLTLGGSMSDHDAEELANFTRRLLNSAFGVMWTVLAAPHVTIKSRNAHEWPPKGSPSGAA